MKLFRWLVLGTLSCLVLPAQAVTLSENSVQWQPLTVDVIGPLADETDESPNPFLDYRLTIKFTAPDGETFDVPGFFAGNGLGGGTGDVWRARFTPDRPGSWTYAVSLVAGSQVAVSESLGTPVGEHGVVGTVMVASRDTTAPGFLADGRIDYVGEHYLKQVDGNYWIKGGVDSPENFFGYAGFDNTYNQLGGAGSAGLERGVHRYEPHIADWREGDPLFVSADTGVDSKGIIGAINYLADQKINSIYFLPMNLGGDGRETYPFISPNGSFSDNTHYDVSKLYQWNSVLSHMQRKGIAAHIVLAETEIDNKNWFDDGQLGVERKLFYRELVARFSYLNAIKWNLSEESRYGADLHREFATYLRQLDWASHPIAVHTDRDKVDEQYEELLGDSTFDVTSIQYSKANANLYVETWRNRSAEAGWKWVVEMDEIDPARIGADGSNSDELRRTILYPVYFSGGSLEWYFGYHELPLGGDIRVEDFRTRESLYRYTWAARKFMQENLPFWEMQPADKLLAGGSTGDQVFAKEGSSYAVYLNDGSAGKRLLVQDGSYQLSWYNPRIGEFAGSLQTVTGPMIELGAAPEQPEEDWVILVKTVDGEDAVGSPDSTVDGDSAPVDASTGTGTGTGEQEPALGAGSSAEEGMSLVKTNDTGIGAAFWLVLVCLFSRSLRRYTGAVNGKVQGLST